ncbi:MAG: hypothetical protein AAGE59_09485 [Cyanobacteria bacterium P01_F01_bin.86]
MHKKYLYFVLSITFVIVAPISAVNYVLGMQYWNNAGLARTANTWQNETKGIANLPANQIKLYKHYQFESKAKQVSAVVLGSSTIYPISGDMIENKKQLFNASYPTNRTSSVLRQAEYIQEHFDNINLFILEINWVLGYLTQNRNSKSYERLIQDAQASEVPAHVLLKDSITMTRFNDLLDLFEKQKKIYEQANEEDEIAFRWIFNEYECTTGQIAKDFSTRFMGTCDGFDDDGAATYFGRQHAKVNNNRHRQILKKALAGKFQFYNHLSDNKRKPNKQLLDSLTKLALEFEGQGKQVVFLMPPLLPNFEKSLLANPTTAANLSEIKEAVFNWAAENNLNLIDAGQSENFDCVPSDFIDGHHATRECFDKVFASQHREVLASQLTLAR